MSSFTPINALSTPSAMATESDLADRVSITLFCKLRSPNCNHACRPGTTAEHHGHPDLLRNTYLIGYLRRQNHPSLTTTRANDFVSLYLRLGYHPEVVSKEMEVHKMLREKLYADGDLSKCYLVEMRQDCHICKVTFRHNLIVRADGVGSFRPAAVNEADLNFSVIPKPDERWNLKGKRSASSTTEKADGEEPLKDVEMEEGEIEARPMNMN